MVHNCAEAFVQRIEVILPTSERRLDINSIAVHSFKHAGVPCI